ncbi:heavy-metal-associated domain-containing protein [Kocuria flava]|nr:heavy-metal-associated domain-containing protein [Kocuria flava]MCJ8504247.1 heavy-metal-associated domain-containing protein [Kocuria flava]
MQTVISVSGMTCGHCVAAVTEELTALEGVQAVDVDLVAGGVSPVTVTAERELSPSEVQEAVEEAGYSIA